MDESHLTFRIEPNLKKQFKLSCTEKDTDMTEVLIHLIQNYVNKNPQKKSA